MIQVELTKEELNIVTALMDAGVRAVGLQAMRPELQSVLDKLATAAKANGADQGA